MCSGQLCNRKDMNIQNVFLLVMENKGYEHLECVLASNGTERICTFRMCSCQLWNKKDMNIQNVFLLVMEQKGYEHLECVLASNGIERI